MLGPGKSLAEASQTNFYLLNSFYPPLAISTLMPTSEQAYLAQVKTGAVLSSPTFWAFCPCKLCIETATDFLLCPLLLPLCHPIHSLTLFLSAGPVIKAEVGDTILVMFANKASWPFSIQPHGVLYGKEWEGAIYHNGLLLPYHLN